MATIKVYAKPGHMLAYPGENRVGHLRNYVGRKTKVTRNEKGEVTEISHKAIGEALEFELDSAEGRRIARLFVVDREDPPLWPADKETAALLNTEFVPVSLQNGEWVAAPAPVETKKASKAGGDQ